jgi:hypothetical protein
MRNTKIVEYGKYDMPEEGLKMAEDLDSMRRVIAQLRRIDYRSLTRPHRMTEDFRLAIEDAFDGLNKAIAICRRLEQQGTQRFRKDFLGN